MSEESSNDMDITQPAGTIKPQVLTNTPITGGQTCLVNDTAHTVNDPAILTGSQSTPIAPIRIHTQSNAPKGSIKLRR